MYYLYLNKYLKEKGFFYEPFDLWLSGLFRGGGGDFIPQVWSFILDAS